MLILKKQLTCMRCRQYLKIVHFKVIENQEQIPTFQFLTL